MAHILSELTNEIYDVHDNVDVLLGDEAGGNLVRPDGTVSPYAIFLGVFVSLIPKIVPRLLPNFVRDDAIRERFDDVEYVQDVEKQFMAKFAENLETMEKLVIAWRDSDIDLSDLNLMPDNPLGKEELVAGEPSGFQNNLLKGIRFLQYRVSRMQTGEDRITRLADTLWGVFETAYVAVRQLFKGTN